MQSNPRLSANLLVILVKILVNLLVKLTKSGVGGAMGGGAQPPTRASPGPYFARPKGWPEGQPPEASLGDGKPKDNHLRNTLARRLAGNSFTPGVVP